jgi:hypothetical protein
MQYGYKGRTFHIGMLVDVYKNLHTGSFSIRCAKSKLVLGHCETVRLQDGIFKVSESGRLKTISEKRKRVHAYVRGTLLGVNESRDDSFTQLIYYNPYVTSHFVNNETHSVIERADEVFIEGKFCFIREEQQLWNLT